MTSKERDGGKAWPPVLAEALMRVSAIENAASADVKGIAPFQPAI